MSRSILVDDMKHCVFCGSPVVEEHHVFFGTANRSLSEKYKLIIPACNKHHTGSGDCPHRNRIIDLALKCWAQSVYEKEIGDRNDFRREFGKSYL
jgi:hypothetical protein